jgi:hypothetical protein
VDVVFSTNGEQANRVVECPKYKGDTNYIETRYYRLKHGGARVSLTVRDEPWKKRTLSQMVARLGSVYCQYQGVCEKVVDIAIRSRK